MSYFHCRIQGGGKGALPRKSLILNFLSAVQGKKEIIWTVGPTQYLFEPSQDAELDPPLVILDVLSLLLICFLVSQDLTRCLAGTNIISYW